MSISDFLAPTDDDTGVSRRTVMRVGAGSAFAVPLISVATMAPAMAVSVGSNAVLRISTGISRHGNKVILTTRISNSGDAPTAKATTVTFSMARGTNEFHSRPTISAPAGSGWSAPVLGGGKAGPWTWTFVLGSKLKAPSVSPTLRFVLTTPPALGGKASIKVNARSSLVNAPSKTVVVPRVTAVTLVANKAVVQRGSKVNLDVIGKLKPGTKYTLKLDSGWVLARGKVPASGHVLRKVTVPAFSVAGIRTVNFSGNGITASTTFKVIK